MLETLSCWHYIHISDCFAKWIALNSNRIHETRDSWKKL